MRLQWDRKTGLVCKFLLSEKGIRRWEFLPTSLQRRTIYRKGNRNVENACWFLKTASLDDDSGLRDAS
jgi:hypothetical protein